MLFLSERAKKLALVALFLAIACGVGFALYLTFFRTASEPVVEPGMETPLGGSLPGSGTARPATSTAMTEPGRLPGGVTTRPGETPGEAGAQPGPESRTRALVDQQTQFVTANAGTSSGDLRFYNPADGKFYRVDALGNTTPLSDKAFYNVKEVSWGHASDKAILEFPDGSNVYFSFQEDRQITLPKHWEDFNFAPDDRQIIAKSVGNNETNRFLVIANPDGSNAQAIQELGDNADKVETVWTPHSQIVAYAHTGDPMGFDREQVVLVGRNQENLPGLITEGRGFIPSWSPTGAALAYSVYNSGNGYLPELWVSDGTAEGINSRRRRIELNTWADKCGWRSDQVLLCAVPSSLEQGAGLQRNAARKGPDQIYRVDLRTGQKTNLGRVDGVTDVQGITIAPDARSAYLVDRATGRIVTFNLQP